MCDSSAADAFDFGHLPDIVWVEIMSLLPLEDRYHLSVCCHALYDAFHHPSLWQTVNISFMGSNGYLTSRLVEVPKKYYAIVTKFAHCFQDLTLKISGGLQPLSDDWLEILVGLEKGGWDRLERLTLDVGDTKSHHAVMESPADGTGIHTLLGFIRASARLKCLIIKAWPLHQYLSDRFDILTIILENEKLKEHLETLSLYWPKKNNWVTRNGIVPTVDKTKALINHLSALQHLSLRSTMIDEEIIDILSREERAPLKHLDILVIYSPHDNLSVPEISSASWLALRQHARHLKVTCSVMTRVPAMELSAMLKPEVPLVAMTFLKYSYCDGEILLRLAAKYNRTLTQFIDFSFGEASDKALLELVIQCKLLKYLVYHRSVHFSTVQKLAEMRGKNWEQFEFKGESIITQELEEGERSDVIVEQREAGVFVVKDFRNFETEEVHELKLKEVTSDVCEKVGYNWAPL